MASGQVERQFQPRHGPSVAIGIGDCLGYCSHPAIPTDALDLRDVDRRLETTTEAALSIVI
jgi:hypothetical protein